MEASGFSDASARTILVDFSSPNVAKPMHVGHIRSTFLGDCICRILRFLGHRVISDNHIGDWGTQFGKLILGWKHHLDEDSLKADALGEMDRLYRRVNALCENQPEVLEKARLELLKLQNGEAENRVIWNNMIALSKRQFETIYTRLGVRFDQSLGESFYNDRLQSLTKELETKGIAQRSQGALVVFFPDDDELKAHPAMIQKSDGAANYMTTDLATLAFRCDQWAPDEIIYITDARQQLHFKQLFRIFQKWRPEQSPKLIHTWFGAILGKDGKPFKTRAGEVVKLSSLLDEAEARARKIVDEKNPNLSEIKRAQIAKIVGIGAVKYADLLPNRHSDYVFDWDTMLALKGNTAPYLQYAFTRIAGIWRKAGLGDGAEVLGKVRLRQSEEIALAKHLSNFRLTLDLVLEDYRPNHLCAYLFELACLLSRFYENCPILKSDESTRASRLRLIGEAGKIIAQGLNLLGIEVSKVM